MTRYIAWTAAVLLTAACGTSGATPPAEVRVKLTPTTTIERSPEEAFAELAQIAATTTTPPAVRRVAVRRSSRRVGVVGASPSAAGRAAPSGRRHHEDIYDDLAHCEAGHRNDLGDPYWGYFQFKPSTWRSLGLTGLPSDHSYEVQKDAARRLVARSGWGQFPRCSRLIGAL